MPTETKTACDHLRDVLRYRLAAWDASTKAEKLIDQDVDTQTESVDQLLAGMNAPEDVDQVTDEQLAEVFDVKLMPAEAPSRKRRKYVDGRCQDCGHEKKITTIVFWATGLNYRVCGQCIKPYHGQILKAQ